MGITTVKLVSQKLFISKISFNGFKPVCAQLSEITDSNHIMIFRVGAEMDVIFVDFSREKSLN